MKKQFLSLIIAGLMLGEASRVHAMDQELPPLFHTEDEQGLLLDERDKELMLLSENLAKPDKKRSIEQIDHHDNEDLECDDSDEDEEDEDDNISAINIQLLNNAKEQSHNNNNNNNNNAEGPFKCLHQGCPATFLHKSGLYFHLSKKHASTAKLFTCSFCTMFPNNIKAYYLERAKYHRASFIRHLAAHTQPYPCEHCSERFPRKYMLLSHQESAHGATNNASSARTNISPCLACGLQGITDLLKHKPQCRISLEHALRRMQIEPSNENMIKVGFNDSRYEKANEFKCTICDQVFTTSAGLSIHTSMRHNSQKSNPLILSMNIQPTITVNRVVKASSPQCPICFAMCKTAQGCTIHIAKSHKLRLNPASNAYEYVHDTNEYSPPTLHEKIEVKEGDMVSYKYKCLYPTNAGICGTLTKPYSSSIAMHQIIHNDEKPFKCPLCPRRFKRNTEVTAHCKRCHLTDMSDDDTHNANKSLE